MDIPEKFNTGLSGEEVAEAFRRLLNSMTDDELNAKFAEISARIESIEKKTWQWKEF